MYGRSLVTGEAAEFYVDYKVYKNAFVSIGERVAELDAYGIAGVPKITDKIGNVGTITFLAVNPKSENLKDTLAYISALVKYMLTKQDSFILTDETMYTNALFIQELYQLYANGEIDFRMDSEVYREEFDAYITGEIGLEEAIAEAERKRKIYVGE